MDVNEIKALISPNRPGGVSALELEKASRLIDELDDLARQTVTGCVDIARRERARADAAEAECERLREQVAQAKADGANEERSLHWIRENMELVALRKQVATLEIDHEKLLAMVVDLQDDYSNALKGAYIAEAKVSDLNEQVASLSGLLDKAAALYADEWPSHFEDEVSAALEATA